jgi:hypothetical protein
LDFENLERKQISFQEMPTFPPNINDLFCLSIYGGWGARDKNSNVGWLGYIPFLPKHMYYFLFVGNTLRVENMVD